MEPIRPTYDIQYQYVRSIEQTFRWFEGFMKFKFAVRDLLLLSPRLDGMKIVVKAEVGERFLDLIEMGESATIVFNSTLKLAFLGNSPQVYKPGMPFKAYVSNWHTRDIYIYIYFYMSSFSECYNRIIYIA